MTIHASRRIPIVRFVIILALLMGLFYASLPMLNRSGVIPAYLGVNARVTATILRWIGHCSNVHGTQIASTKFSVEIRQGCDASEPMALFIASVLAFRATWRSKITGVIVGTAVLALANLIRILALYFTGVYWPRAFDIMHLDICQALFIVLTLSLWVSWALRAVGFQTVKAHVEIEHPHE